MAWKRPRESSAEPGGFEGVGLHWDVSLLGMLTFCPLAHCSRFTCARNQIFILPPALCAVRLMAPCDVAGYGLRQSPTTMRGHSVACCGSRQNIFHYLWWQVKVDTSRTIEVQNILHYATDTFPRAEKLIGVLCQYTCLRTGVGGGLSVPQVIGLIHSGCIPAAIAEGLLEAL